MVDTSLAEVLAEYRPMWVLDAVQSDTQPVQLFNIVLLYIILQNSIQNLNNWKVINTWCIIYWINNFCWWAKKGITFMLVFFFQIYLHKIQIQVVVDVNNKNSNYCYKYLFWDIWKFQKSKSDNLWMGTLQLVISTTSIPVAVGVYAFS